MHFDIYFWFILLFNLISWRQKYQIKYNRKLLFVRSRYQMNLQFSILFSDQECLTQQLLKVSFKLKFLNILASWKKVTAPSRVWKFWEYSLCQNSALIMANGIRKVRKGVDIFDKKMLILASSSRTQCFRIRPHQQQSFPCVSRV